ncbi:MAG: serine hydrolase [Parasphingorhabdus sp.]|uniref:serine hydrolase n=1 Tax=Parasphingorhabdus sp. TaxID=2709688 RepID=UPI003299F918
MNMMLLCRALAMTAVVMILSACSSVSSKPVPLRNIAEQAKLLQGATVLDVDRFEPVETIGQKCTVRPIARNDSAVTDRLNAALEQAKSYSDAQKGIGLMVVWNGSVIHETYEQGTDAQTQTDSYSMNKSLLGLAYMAALEDGIIPSLDVPISRYISEWDGDPRGDLTLRQVLHMESGLKVYSFQEPGSKALALMLQSDINAVALSYPATEPAGKQFKYNNVNSQLAGLALSRALQSKAKISYPRFVEQRIWCPIGNGKADFWLDRKDGSIHHFAALFSSLENWARLGELIRNQGHVGEAAVIGSSWIAKMAEPAATNAAYGLHIWRGAQWQKQRRYNPENPLTVLHSEKYLADDIMFFDGFGGQRVYIIPSAGLTIARTGQVNFQYDDSKIVNILLRALQDD